MKVLFLYTGLPAYFHTCVRHLTANHPVQASIIHWDNTREAPFELEADSKVIMQSKSSFSNFSQLLRHCRTFNPDLVYISGWIDKLYLRIAYHFRQTGSIVIMGMDNPWTGNFRQQLARLIGPVILPHLFTHVWVPGAKQYHLALKLGFTHGAIISGLYSADIDQFQSTERNAENHPRELVYVGRLIPRKGILDLYQAFRNLSPEHGWRLTIIGNGPLRQELQQAENIRLYPFMQPAALAQHLSSAGAACLPSWFEPWGVVVHEYAALGLPMVLSDKVNAAEAFLETGKNGWIFPAKNRRALQNTLEELFSRSDNELRKMGQHSRALSKQITPDSWAQTLIQLFKEKN